MVPEAVGREPVLSQRILAALPTALTTRLGEQARRAGVTLNSVLTSALGLVLATRPAAPTWSSAPPSPAARPTCPASRT